MSKYMRMRRGGYFVKVSDKLAPDGFYYCDDEEAYTLAEVLKLGCVECAEKEIPRTVRAKLVAVERLANENGH